MSCNDRHGCGHLAWAHSTQTNNVHTSGAGGGGVLVRGSSKSLPADDVPAGADEDRIGDTGVLGATGEVHAAATVTISAMRPDCTAALPQTVAAWKNIIVIRVIEMITKMLPRTCCKPSRLG